MPTYLYTDLLSQVVDSARRANITNVITARNYINRGARRVLSDIDLRSSKRNAALSSRLFDDVYSYACPSDLKSDAIIDFIPQVNRNINFRLELLSEQEFDMKKTIKNNVIAVATDDLVKRIKFSGDVKDTILGTATFDSLTADGGTWVLFGDGENVVADTDNYVVGGGSVKFDISSAAGTTAGIQNTDVNDLDITDYVNNGSVFVWVYINSTTDLTNWILRIGNDSSNYYTQTVTTTNEATSFVAGWNLLRFDFASMTETGTVTETAVDYIALYMTKETTKVDNGYRVDGMTLHLGELHNVLYYSRYPWQSSAGAFIENSTADTDYINCESDEFELFVFKAKEELFRELRRFDLAKDAKIEYNELKADYIRKNPSERAHRNRNYYSINLYR
jgi:hypothetical protein